ncbi:N-alpha-acetyltransferase 38, NatC auxiliary subunit [Pseudolycoriella hygida]|uniref:N-alpha-acetyltransferase 38, NatC auxiliary subunit n=1 Tax=Pseudolycoriella hygida TaxID=35572 RepID=A0A9Q0RW81_9DIPT|nr:N-alpha-acetyltransferase 38, NatC auxiliary subunit [Pseudolycoriella hygida]
MLSSSDSDSSHVGGFKRQSENATTSTQGTVKAENTPGREKLRSWLYSIFRIVLSDKRILVGTFLCTDSAANVILGMCTEDTEKGGEERMLGLVMVPGRHIVSMERDETSFQAKMQRTVKPPNEESQSTDIL